MNSLTPDKFKTFEKIVYTIFFFLFSEEFVFVLAPVFRNTILRNMVFALSGDSQANVIQTVQLTWAYLVLPLFLHCIFVFALISFLAQPLLLKKAIRAGWKSGILALLMLTTLSLVWSILPTVTFQRLIHLFELTLIGLYISQRFSLKEIIHLLVIVFFSVGVFSLLAVWLNPRQSIHPGGEWRGIYTWKNFLGRFMALGNMSAVVYWLSNRAIPKRIFAVVLFVLTAVLIFFSRSTTSLGLVTLIYSGLILWAMWKKWLRHTPAWLRWSVTGLAGVVLTLSIWQFNNFLGMLNKTVSLESRFTLWGILWEPFQERPWLGFGYGAYWAQFPNGFMPPGPGWDELKASHAHNGYFDVTLTLGIVGLVIFLVVLALAWKRTWQNYSNHKLPILLWPCMVLAHFTLSNLVYSLGLEFPLFFWVLFVIVSSLPLQVEHDQPVSLPQQPTT